MCDRGRTHWGAPSRLDQAVRNIAAPLFTPNGLPWHVSFGRGAAENPTRTSCVGSTNDTSGRLPSARLHRFADSNKPTFHLTPPSLAASTLPNGAPQTSFVVLRSSPEETPASAKNIIASSLMRSSPLASSIVDSRVALYRQ